MLDHSKIEEAIDNYFNNTPTAKIIENLDRHGADRDKDLERENINRQATNNKDSIVGNLVRFEEVSPANQDAAFLTVSIEQLVAHLGLPLYEGYDDLDEMRLTFLTLPSGETVTIGEYLNCPQPGTSIYVDAAMQNIPQIVFESCLQLQVAREEVIWFHPDWQEEIDRLYAEHGAIEKRTELSQLEELPQLNQYEPIDCFNHALKIYAREFVPATYWAMLQHNLGLAYFNRKQGDRKENLERSIKCFNKSLEIFTQDKFPEKWKMNQQGLKKSLKSLLLLQEELFFMNHQMKLRAIDLNPKI
jgi:tetratricopeptide (TPR) repeat protein